MAYGVKYRTTIAQRKTNFLFYVDIMQDGYVGSVTTLKTSKDSCKMTIDSAEYFTPVRTRNFQMDIINDLANFFTLDELFTAGDFQYQVRVYDTTRTYFRGFIPCDVVEQRYLPKEAIIVYASDNLKRLESLYPTMFSLNTGYRLIDIVEHCLSKTGLSLPVYVNCHWGSSAIYFEKYINSDLFLENDVEYKDCFFILESILKSANCILYYYNDIWYIEREKDRGTTIREFVNYSLIDSSDYVNEDKIIYNIDNTDTDIRFIETRQTIGYLPGKKRILLNLQEKIKENLVSYYYDILEAVNWDTWVIPTPAINTWQYFNTTIIESSSSYANYKIDSIELTGQDIPVDGLIEEDTVVDYIRANFAISGDNQMLLNRQGLQGIYHTIRISLNTNTDTTITIKGIFTLPQDFLNITMNNGRTIQQDLSLYPKNHKFYARCLLKGSQTYISILPPYTEYGIFYGKPRNETENRIMIRAASNGALYDTGYVNPAIFYICISFDAFTDKNNYATEFSCSATIKKADTESWMVEQLWVIGICEVGYSNEIDTIGAVYQTLPGFGNIYYDSWLNYDSICWAIKHSIFSDIVVSVTNQKEDNVVYADNSVSDFIEEYEDDLLIYSGLNANILNALCEDEDLIILINLIFDLDDESLEEALTIQNKVIKERFQVFNKTRRRITCDSLYYEGVLRIFQFATDTNFTDKEFSINGFTYCFESGIYENLELLEYILNDNIS